MEALITRLQVDFPVYTFEPAEEASWSSHRQCITYTLHDESKGVWSVLHEVGHAVLNHTNYRSDAELLRMEAAAWDQALVIAERYDVVIPQYHRESCLDTYRDWLHRRSTCPNCNSHGLQQPDKYYRCLNCQQKWQVSPNRFCRPYRLSNP
jgi:hypothetical protein